MSPYTQPIPCAATVCPTASTTPATCRVDTSRAPGAYRRTPPETRVREAVFTAPGRPSPPVPDGSATGPSTTGGPFAPSAKPSSASARSYRLGSTRPDAARAT
ncbi:hypothetical protein ACFV2U_38580 [Streptomyces sp. NPDC059697]|uniref:hypothetical protein n=1 Tax=Streptomyces sp. NPDC059697 TaxID=3346912 RepID=UPI0036D0EC10